MDNAAIHHYTAGQILGSFLDEIGCVLIYLPTYSPELNPTEFVFNKMRSILKRYEYREILRQSLHVGVYEAISNVTSLISSFKNDY
jgi:transposase